MPVNLWARLWSAHSGLGAEWFSLFHTWGTGKTQDLTAHSSFFFSLLLHLLFHRNSSIFLKIVGKSLKAAPAGPYTCRHKWWWCCWVEGWVFERRHKKRWGWTMSWPHGLFMSLRDPWSPGHCSKSHLSSLTQDLGPEEPLSSLSCLPLSPAPLTATSSHSVTSISRQLWGSKLVFGWQCFLLEFLTLQTFSGLQHSCVLEQYEMLLGNLSAAFIKAFVSAES